MSNKLTYIEARDKIWAAYFRDEIKPAEPQFCFCGTLRGNDTWASVMEDGKDYNRTEFGSMEKALFLYFPVRWLGLCRLTHNEHLSYVDQETLTRMEDYEERLFTGMLAALEVLKQIHRDRGDFIPEDEPLLTKRNLEHA